MANMDLLSYERDSRWMPHLSWSHLDWSLQQKMEQQAAQREQTWQKIADKLGPLLVAGDASGCSFGQSDYIVRDIEDQDYLEKAYEKAPLLATQTSRQNLQSYQTTTKQQTPIPGHIDPTKQSKSPTPTPVVLATNENVQKHKHHLVEEANYHHDQYECESLKKAKRRCWTVSSILILLVFLLFIIVILMAFGILKLQK